MHAQVMLQMDRKPIPRENLVKFRNHVFSFFNKNVFPEGAEFEYKGYELD